MNRRNLVKRCGQALLGVGATVVGVKAAQDRPIDLARPEKKTELHIFIHAEPPKTFEEALFRAVMEGKCG